MVTLVLFTIILEFLISWGLSVRSGWLLIDTLFMTSILFFVLGWLSAMSRNYENTAKAAGKYLSGKETGQVTVYKFSLTPAIAWDVPFREYKHRCNNHHLFTIHIINRRLIGGA
ncbi:hypothetical protein [Alkalihalobacillus sp. AL-G]|uniref:hypothetical protein n=1 Tax=Alkalihalobacillus sp. AL-G TaxID=2926399 RepID=UPI00272D3897|nr:hypothetical protein [Alkalihalobacillus sp. AL-G]WLD92166.1 hypothetical protein MOJ78_14185 [Alkalihalobacillus sp. AL-G]